MSIQLQSVLAQRGRELESCLNRDGSWEPGTVIDFPRCRQTTLSTWPTLSDKSSGIGLLSRRDGEYRSFHATHLGKRRRDEYQQRCRQHLLTRHTSSQRPPVRLALVHSVAATSVVFRHLFSLLQQNARSTVFLVFPLPLVQRLSARSSIVLVSTGAIASSQLRILHS